MGIGVFSPGLDPYGNSVRGVRVCEEISERLGLHVFATEAEDALLGLGSPAMGSRATKKHLIYQVRKANHVEPGRTRLP
jgi:Glutaminase